jgi:hypothetical protein
MAASYRSRMYAAGDVTSSVPCDSPPAATQHGSSKTEIHKPHIKKITQNVN